MSLIFKLKKKYQFRAYPTSKHMFTCASHPVSQWKRIHKKKDKNKKKYIKFIILIVPTKRKKLNLSVFVINERWLHPIRCPISKKVARFCACFHVEGLKLKEKDPSALFLFVFEIFNYYISIFCHKHNNQLHCTSSLPSVVPSKQHFQ